MVFANFRRSSNNAESVFRPLNSGPDLHVIAISLPLHHWWNVSMTVDATQHLEGLVLVRPDSIEPRPDVPIGITRHLCVWRVSDPPLQGFEHPVLIQEPRLSQLADIARATRPKKNSSFALCNASRALPDADRRACRNSEAPRSIRGTPPSPISVRDTPRVERDDVSRELSNRYSPRRCRRREEVTCDRERQAARPRPGQAQRDA